MPKVVICEHGRRRSECKECGGSSICEHGRRRKQCKECGGSQICEHGRQRNTCKECGGGSICEHGRRRYYCKECGGKGICDHGKVRHSCKECRAAGNTSTTADKKRRQQPAHEASEPAAKRHSQSGATSGEHAAVINVITREYGFLSLPPRAPAAPQFLCAPECDLTSPCRATGYCACSSRRCSLLRSSHCPRTLP